MKKKIQFHIIHVLHVYYKFKCWTKNTHTHIQLILFDITFCVCRCLSIANVFFHSAFDVYILNELAARDFFLFFFFVLRGLFNDFIDTVATSVFELHTIHGIKVLCRKLNRKSIRFEHQCEVALYLSCSLHTFYY